MHSPRGPAHYSRRSTRRARLQQATQRPAVGAADGATGHAPLPGPPPAAAPPLNASRPPAVRPGPVAHASARRSAASPSATPRARVPPAGRGPPRPPCARSAPATLTPAPPIPPGMMASAAFCRASTDRRRAGARGQADPLTADDVAAIIATASLPRRTGRGMESEAAAADRGAVDKALVGLLFQGWGCAGRKRRRSAGPTCRTRRPGAASWSTSCSAASNTGFVRASAAAGVRRVSRPSDAARGRRQQQRRRGRSGRSTLPRCAPRGHSVRARRDGRRCRDGVSPCCSVMLRVNLTTAAAPPETVNL